MKKNAADFLPKDLDFNYSQKINSTSINRIQQRAKIVVLNQIEVPKHEIACFVGQDISTVNRWTERFYNTTQLNDNKRSGCPETYNEIVRLKTISLCCQTNPLPGYSHFSLRDTASYMTKHPEIYGCSMSYSTIRRLLRSHSLKPHLTRYFLNITDPDFFPKMEHLCNLYLYQPEYLFCFDECPGLQALMPMDPDLPAIENKPNYFDSLYTRNGRIDLFAFLRVKTGHVVGYCRTSHSRHTLIPLFKQHVSMQPSDVQLHYIMDNLSTHFHDDLCNVVAELSKVKYFHLATGPQRREWLQKDDKRIVFHFTPFHGSWLNMVEIFFGILNQKCINPRRFENVDSLISIILDFIDTYNKYFAHPFTWKYKGDGLYEKAVSRFNKLLILETKQMDISFLNKQLLLMTNISKLYPQILKTNLWAQLDHLINEKKRYLQNIIQDSSKARIKKSTQENFENLNKILNCQF